jgi:hypothetical protein
MPSVSRGPAVADRRNLGVFIIRKNSVFWKDVGKMTEYSSFRTRRRRLEENPPPPEE